MRRLVLAVGALALMSPAVGQAQFESALLSKIPFNVANPGGKSLAMGGAFTAIADDATAALANPAGLGLLSSIEVGVSLKRFDNQIELATARATATGPNFVVPYPEVRTASFGLSDTRSAVEYAGVVVPISSRFVVALTYAENLGFRADPGEDGYAYVELRDNRSSGGTTRRDYLFEYRELGTVSLTNRLLGFSVAYRLNERFRLGFGITAGRIAFDVAGDAGGQHRIVSRTFISALQTQRITQEIDVRGLDGVALGGIVGIHADVLAQGLLTAGASARFSARRHGTLLVRSTSETSGPVPNECVLGAVPPPAESEVAFGVPADVAVGGASQPLPGLTVAVEGQWIRYSGVSDAPRAVVPYCGIVTGSDLAVKTFADLSRPRDVVVPRLGVEYVAAADRLRLAFRVGWHREPAHGVTANLVARDASAAYDLVDPPYSSAVRKVFDGGRPDDRFSGGIGATFDRRISLDLSFDVGRASRQLSASLFYRF